jgi:hypothetical protein
MDEIISQVAQAGSPGPVNRSIPSHPARENPTTPATRLTKVRVPEAKLKVPSPSMVIEALLWSIKYAFPKDDRVEVSPNATIVKEAFTNGVPPIEPLPAPWCTNVIGSALTFEAPSTKRVLVSTKNLTILIV